MRWWAKTRMLFLNWKRLRKLQILTKSPAKIETWKWYIFSIILSKCQGEGLEICQGLQTFLRVATLTVIFTSGRFSFTECSSTLSRWTRRKTNCSQRIFWRHLIKRKPNDYTKRALPVLPTGTITTETRKLLCRKWTSMTYRPWKLCWNLKFTFEHFAQSFLVFLYSIVLGNER